MNSRRSSTTLQVDRRRSSVGVGPDGVVGVTSDGMRRMSEIDPELVARVGRARDATSKEHELTIAQALRLYPKAIGFSLLFSTAIVMEGFDLALMGSFWGFPAFRDYFGDQPDPENPGQLVISAPWQSGVSNGVQAGSIIGLLINGYVSDIFGYKKTMFCAMLANIAFTFLFFFAQNLGMITAGAVLCGIPWGIFQTISVTYASDVAPVCLRAYLTTYVNLCWVMGQLIASGVLRGFLDRTDEWAWRIPFALQWVLPVPILIGTCFAPESPWWLVRKGRLEDARRSLASLISEKSGIPFNIDDQVAMYKATDDLEKATNVGQHYWHCFQGVDRRRTEIACVAWVTQAFCGAALMGYAVQMFQRAGLNDEDTFSMNIGMYAMGGVGTFAAWWMMSWCGRRTMYIYGLSILLVILLGVGFSGIPARPNVPASWAAGSLLLVYAFVYNCTVGPVCYSIVAEIPSTRLKIKTVVLARNLYNIGGIINNILMPRMIGLNEWNWGPLTGFFWAGACFCLLVYSYFRLPEPKGRTYGELDLLFEHRVSARKFASTQVEQFGEHAELEKKSSGTDGFKTVAEHVA